MQIVRDADHVLDLELMHLRHLKQQLAELQQSIDDKTELVSSMLLERGQKSRTHYGFRYTLVQAERVKINELGLKKALGARLFNKLTVAKVDQNKLKSAIAEGIVDPVVLEQHSEVVLNKPSIRITEVSDGE